MKLTDLLIYINYILSCPRLLKLRMAEVLCVQQFLGINLELPVLTVITWYSKTLFGISSIIIDNLHKKLWFLQGKISSL